MANSIELELGVLGAIVGISTSDLQSKLFKSEGDQTVAKSKSEVDKILKELHGSKLADVKKIQKDESYQHGRKSAFEEIETKAKEDFDISMNWTADGFGKIANHLQATKSKNPDDIRKSETYIADKADWEKNLQTEKDAHIATKQGHNKTSIESQALSEIRSRYGYSTLTTDDERKSFDRKAKLAIRSFDDDPKAKVIIKDGQPTIVDKTTNQPYLDADHNSVPFGEFVTKSTSFLFSDVKPNPKPTIRDDKPKPTSSESITFKQGDNEKTIQFPDFKKSEEEYLKWADKMELEDKPYEVIQQGRQHFESTLEKVES